MGVLLALVPSMRALGNSAEPADVLRTALQKRHDYDVVQLITMTQRDRFGDERRIVLQMAQKSIDERLHALVRFEAPESLRGTRVLSIEADGRSDDHFLFLKSQQKVRRVRATGKDAFMGTDFSMEDMERRQLADFSILDAESIEIDGAPALSVAVEPLYESAYARIEYVISPSDSCILRVRYFKTEATAPFKELIVPREFVETIDRYPIGMRAFVRHVERGTETHVRIERIEINPKIKSQVFSQQALTVDRDLFR